MGAGARLSDAERERFDELLHDLIGSFHGRLAALVEEVPIVVLDAPDVVMVKMLRADGTLGPEDDGSDVCGMHSGVGLPDRSIEDPSGAAWGASGGGPEQIYLFREGIIGLALEEPLMDEDDDALEGEERSVAEQSIAQRGDNPQPEWQWGDAWPDDADERIYEEIRITLLHEIGHHFGLDEEDLEELGYQ